MRRFILFTFIFLLSSCSSPVPTALPTPAPDSLALYVFRASPPTLLQLSADLTSIEREIPVALPQECLLGGLYPSPRRDLLVAETFCTDGPLSLLVDPATGAATPLLSESGVDSHFLAWAADGRSVYLRADSLGDPHIVRVDVSQPASDLPNADYPISNYTYDLAFSPDGVAAFTFSRGFGFGSEVWATRDGGRTSSLLLADPNSFISFLRWSPDGSQIAFIKIPDTQTPFTVGGLWLMDADGSHPRKLADADAGHGYAASWSPDGKRLAFVLRSNPDEAEADRSAEALISNLAVVELASGAVTQVTHFTSGRVEAPAWSPDGNFLAFNNILNGRMDVRVIGLTGELVPLFLTEPACCPTWMRK